MSDSLWPMPKNSPGQNTGVGSLSLLQGIFITQGSNPGLPHYRQILYQLNHREGHKIHSRPSINVDWVGHQSTTQFLRLQHGPVAVPLWSNSSLAAGEERELVTVTGVRWEGLQGDLTVQPPRQMCKCANMQACTAETPCKCQECGKTLTRNPHSFQHGRIHSGGNPWEPE